MQLVAFEKSSLLAPGASEDVTVAFDPAYFASYDENAVKTNGTQGAWVLEDGEYYFAVGNGAHEALNNILAAKTGSEDGLVKTAETESIEAANALVWSLAATDRETYSVGVQNQLQDMDISKLLPGTVEYTTRADWTKGWTPVAALTPTEAMLIGLTDKLYTLNANDNDGNPVIWGESGPYKDYGYFTTVDYEIEDIGAEFVCTVSANDDFFKCNSCYLVNLDHVRAVSDNTALVGGDRLQISRARKKAFMEALARRLAG